MLGEKGMWFKQYFFEPSTKVPLIIRFPSQFRANRVKKLVSLVDLFPTLLDLATNGNIPEIVSSIDGNSLSSLLNNDNSKWDNIVISEYTGEGVVSPCRMIRRNNYKYIYTHGHPPILYDLKSDPLELHNISGQDQVSEIELQLVEEIMTDWDPDEIYNSCIQSQKKRLLIQKATAGEPTWAHVVQAGDERRYVRNASAVGVKSAARYPFVEPTPFK